jgi:uncharacterized membrane protein
MLHVFPDFFTLVESSFCIDCAIVKIILKIGLIANGSIMVLMIQNIIDFHTKYTLVALNSLAMDALIFIACMASDILERLL